MTAIPAQQAIDNAVARRIAQQCSADLDMLIESDRGMTRKAMIDWLIDNHPMTQAEAESAYKKWREDVA